MSFSGGVFSRIYSWVTDKNNSINITASRMDTEMDGMATGLSTCMLKDGTQTITADIPMASHKFTGLSAGSARTDSASIAAVQDGVVNWIAGGGTADAITATYSPAVTALIDGMEVDFRASAANATTTPTFAPSGLTAHTITKKGGSALAIGDIPAALAECKLRYNLANTRWELLNPYSAAQNIPVTVIPSAQLDATTNTTLANITGMVQTVVAGTYLIRIHLSGTSGASGGWKVAFKLTTTVITSWGVTSYFYAGTSLNKQRVTTTTDQTTLQGVTTNIDDGIIEAVAVIGTGGTMQLQFAQNASNGTTSSIYTDSSMTFTKIA